MELTGTVIAILPAQSGVSQRTGNTWMSQEYVIEVPGQYPRRCCFKIFGEDRIKQFAIQQGEQNVTVQFDIDAHEWNGRWFNEIRAYNVLRAAAAPAAAQPTSQAQPASSQQDMFADQGQVAAPANAPALAPFPPAQEQGDNPDDLPF